MPGSSVRNTDGQGATKRPALIVGGEGVDVADGSHVFLLREPASACAAGPRALPLVRPLECGGELGSDVLRDAP